MNKLVDSVILTLIARAAIILATLVGLPAAGWMLQRGISTIDTMGTKIDNIRDQTIETGGAIKMIQQSQQVQGQILADHETRVRMLENLNRARVTVPP